MVRILGYWGPNFSEILHFPRPSKATLVFKKKKKKKKEEKTRRRNTRPREVKDSVTDFSHLRATQRDCEPVDPAT
jgi:hypothetical protein